MQFCCWRTSVVFMMSHFEVKLFYLNIRWQPGVLPTKIIARLSLTLLLYLLSSYDLARLYSDRLFFQTKKLSRNVSLLHFRWESEYRYRRCVWRGRRDRLEGRWLCPRRRPWYSPCSRQTPLDLFSLIAIFGINLVRVPRLCCVLLYCNLTRLRFQAEVTYDQTRVNRCVFQTEITGSENYCERANVWTMV